MNIVIAIVVLLSPYLVSGFVRKRNTSDHLKLSTRQLQVREVRLRETRRETESLNRGDDVDGADKYFEVLAQGRTVPIIKL